ncbi:MAG TPA: hypothetical protein HA250_01190, partial [Nanoarchaeota archaeon]|nr:hypothetical protein [Nanoarchaeota archaeon]
GAVDDTGPGTRSAGLGAGSWRYRALGWGARGWELAARSEELGVEAGAMMFCALLIIASLVSSSLDIRLFFAAESIVLLLFELSRDSSSFSILSALSSRRNRFSSTMIIMLNARVRMGIFPHSS